VNDPVVNQPAPADVVPHRPPSDDELRALWTRLDRAFAGRDAVAVDVSEPGEVQLDGLGTPIAVGPLRVRRRVPMLRPLVTAAELRRLGLDPNQMTGLDVID